jgi:CBS domain-containing protein
MKTIDALLGGREVFNVGADMTVRQVADYMTQRRVGAVAVLEGTRLSGIISERDIMSRVVARGLDPERTPVRDVMTRELVVANPPETHEDCLRRMKQAGCRHLPVVEGDRLVGMVSQRDLLQVDLTEKDEEIRWLNAYIHFIPPVKEGRS